MTTVARWAELAGGGLLALGVPKPVTVDPLAGTVALDGHVLTPDEARRIGGRLIEAAALADTERVRRRSH